MISLFSLLSFHSISSPYTTHIFSFQHSVLFSCFSRRYSLIFKSLWYMLSLFIHYISHCSSLRLSVYVCIDECTSCILFLALTHVQHVHEGRRVNTNFFVCHDSDGSYDNVELHMHVHALWPSPPCHVISYHLISSPLVRICRSRHSNSYNIMIMARYL